MQKNARANRILPGSIPVPGVVSGVLAGKSCRRDANPDTRDACAPQKKSLAQWALRVLEGNEYFMRLPCLEKSSGVTRTPPCAILPSRANSPP